jgi:glycerol-3-phosphate dehydrogenase
VLSVFAGIRPLVRTTNRASTAALARDHVVHIDRSGLVSVMGGKWTTYRHMAEGCVDQAATLAQLPDRPCATHDLHIHGFHREAKQFGPLSVYGADAYEISKLTESNPSMGALLHPALPYVRAEVVWAAREEMARTVEDVLARRTRALFLNAQAALEMAPAVADLMASEFEWDDPTKAHQLSAFRDIASKYSLRRPP